MIDEDEIEPIGEVRRVRSRFWVGDWVLHRCDVRREAASGEGEGPRRGLIVTIMFAGDVRYAVQWSILETAIHDEIELEPAGS